jgi:hypothetical protein
MARFARLLVASCAALCIGCGEGAEPLAKQYGERFLHAKIEGPVISFQQAIQLAGGPAPGSQSDEAIPPQSAAGPSAATTARTNQQQVLIAGTIYGGQADAFDPRRGSFTVIELLDPGHDHEDPGDCVFCKRRLENAEMAVVHLVDAAGDVIEFPASRLPGLQSGAHLLVSGEVELLGEMLVVKARQLQLLDEKQAEAVFTSLQAEAN